MSNFSNNLFIHLRVHSAYSLSFGALQIDKIIDLAKQLISLAGLTTKDKNNPKGDIEITFTGLRSGEKLFEELLLDGNYYETTHKKIFRAVEKFIPFEQLIPKIENIIQVSISQINHKNLK